VARVAQSRSSAGVLTIGVALLTVHRGMRAGQRESRGRMIECRRLPHGLVVADRAVVRQLSSGMIEAGSRGKVRLMTSVAGRRLRRVVAAAVALDAGYADVSAGQGELSSQVSVRRIPVRSRVTGLAGGGESGGLMRGIGTSRVVRLMARVTGSRRAAGVLAVGVALLAVDRGMRACQRESCGGVVEHRGLPRRCRMAD
jgi:hypothetical protein